MSGEICKDPGKISWCDLTVPDATRVSAFYRAVVGWSASGVDMGGYQDYSMMPPGSDAPAAGVCHARGENASMPAQWMIYINVADLKASLAAVEKNGGTVVVPERAMPGYGAMAVIRDPAGAVAGLFEHEKKG